LESWLVNAQDVKQLAGRPKAGKLDGIWLGTVAERQLIRPGLVPPPAIGRLPDLTRWRAGLVAARAAENNRVHKLVEDAQIKLSVVVWGILGVCGRDMLAALVAGQRNPKVVAQLARRTMGNKISVLQEAFPGHFAAHHAFLLAQMPGRVDAITAGIAGIDALAAAIEEQIAPFRCGGRQAR
jgi:transposase